LLNRDRRDVRRARELLSACRDAYRELGMERWAERASSALQRIG
jgi:hypothetical protein